MGLTYATLRLSNPVQPVLAGIECTALADTGAMHLCIPPHIALQLDLQEREKREVTLADGSRKLISYVGPVRIEFANRQCFVGAMVLGDEVLLGAIPMEDLDLIVRPMTREVMVNPAAPNVPSSVAKGIEIDKDEVSAAGNRIRNRARKLGGGAVHWEILKAERDAGCP